MVSKKVIIISSSVIFVLSVVFLSGFYFVQLNNLKINEDKANQEFLKQLEKDNYKFTYQGNLEFAEQNPYTGPEIKINPESVEEKARKANSPEDIIILDEIEKDLFSGYFGLNNLNQENVSETTYYKTRPLNINYIYENSDGKKMYLIETYDYTRLNNKDAESFSEIMEKNFREGDTYNYPFVRALVVKDSSNSKFRYLIDVTERLYCDTVTAEGFEAKSGENCVTLADIEKDPYINLNYRESGYDKYMNEYYKSIEVK